MDSTSLLSRAKKAFVGAALAFLGALAAGWLSGHHLNWAEALDAAVTSVVAWFGVYRATNAPAFGSPRVTRGNLP
jgi:hypothetical protein